MKIIYAEGAFGEPYRVEVSDELLNEVRTAQRTLKRLPWNGEMYLPVPSYAMNKLADTYTKHTVEIVVRKTLVSICSEGPEGRETMLDYPDDLLSVPDIYLSKSFESDLLEHMFSLTPHDIDLIASWKQHKADKLA